MSDLASLIAQLSGSSQQPGADPAMAAVKLARASIDALMLKLGQTIDAKVIGPLPAGLTQLAAGQQSLALKLATPLPTGAAVTIRVTATPQGTPAVIVSMPNAAPQVAQPLPLPAPATSLVQAQGGLQPAKGPEVAQPPTAPVGQPLPQPAPMPQPQQPVARTVVAPSPAPVPAPVHHAQAVAATPVAVAQPAGVPVATGPLSPQPQSAAVAPSTPAMPPPATPAVTAPVPGSPAMQPVPAAAALGLPGAGQAAAQVTLPVGPAPAQPLPAGNAAPLPSAPPGNFAPASAAVPTLTPVAAASSAAVALPVTPAASPVPQPAPAPLLATPLAAIPVQPLPTHASPYPAQVPHADPAVAARQLPLAASTPTATPARAVAPALHLADSAQAAARQDSAAPLLARLAAIVTAAVPVLPRPMLEVAQKVLSGRVDLNRTAPDGKTLETAVLRSGVLLASATRQTPGDSRAALLALRSGLASLLGSDATGPVAPVARVTRPAPPIRGEPPRAPEPQPAAAVPLADGEETIRTLLGQTDATLSRLKLLQSASQPPTDARPDAPAPRSELRVEIPMLLGTQTGILQLLVERDGKQKREQRERGWRMRFAMNFSETGEVGADIAMLGRSASVSIWAADPDVAEALDAMLPELAPAIERHGLALTSLRVRRGTPRSTPAAPGQLLDSAR